MKYLNHNLLSRLGNLPLEARHSMTGNVSGRHRSASRGSSVEFAEYRKYVAGDDTRRLDWKAYARSDRYYIKEFEADTNLRAYIVMDLSGSMNYHPEQVETKYMRACRLAANLAYIAIRQGDAVGLSFARQTKDGAALHIPASRRPAHLNVLISQMDTHSPQGETVLPDTLHELAERVGRRALVLIFSDLFTDTAELKNALRHLHFRKHDVAVFHLVDQLEIDFDFDRPIRFVDMEGGGSLITEPDLIADEYRAIVVSYLEETRRICTDINADYRLVGTGDSLEDVLTVHPGDVVYKDLNQDGKIDDYGDRTHMGFPRTPEIQFGIPFGIQYKGFDISVMFQGSLNSSILLSGAAVWDFPSYEQDQYGKVKHMHLNRWTEATKDVATYPRLTYGAYENNKNGNSSLFLYNANYIRLKNLEVGYSLPKNIIRFAGLQNVRFYVQGLNLLTFDSLDDVDMDPETKEGSGDWYPIQRVYNFGVEITY